MNSYQISSTLNPFFSKTPVKKESKPEKSYFRCKFLKILMYFCYKSEKPRENHRKTRKTLISTENDIERTLLYDERKIPLMDYMDIEESKETPPLSIEIGSNTSLKPSFKGSKPNYPFNKWFIFTNPTNKAQKVLTKISLYIKELKNANKRSFSFIKSPFLTYEPCSLYKSQEKGLVLDIFSDFEGLVSLQREFEDIITLQSNFFVANSLKKRLFLMNIKENMDFVVSDPLKFIYKGGNKRFDVIQLNFMHFQPENIEKNDFLIEITKKYAGLGDFIVVIMPKLAKIEEILSFFAKILYSLSGLSLKLNYSLGKSPLYSAILQRKSSFNEEIDYFIEFFQKETPFPLKKAILKGVFQLLLKEIPPIRLIPFIKALETGISDKKGLLQSFFELLYLHGEISSILKGKLEILVKNKVFFKKDQEKDLKSVYKEELLNESSFNSKSKVIEQRSFSTYSEKESISEGKLNEITINSDSKPLLMKIGKNGSSF